MTTFTIEELTNALPKCVKVSNKLLEDINNVYQGDEDTVNYIKENILTSATILTDGRYTMQNYLNAVKYVSFKMLGKTNMEAWIESFPERYASLKVNNKLDNIHAAVSAYNRTELVQKLLKQHTMTLRVLNRDKGQRALDVLETIMVTSRSDMARVSAAKTILEYTNDDAQNNALAVNINIKDPYLDNLKAQLSELAKAQLSAINQGQDTHNLINSSKVIEHE